MSLIPRYSSASKTEEAHFGASEVVLGRGGLWRDGLKGLVVRLGKMKPEKKYG